MLAVFGALVSNRILSTVSLSFVGRLGATELAAAGLVLYPFVSGRGMQRYLIRTAQLA